MIVASLFAGWLISRLTMEKWVKYAKTAKTEYLNKYEKWVEKEEKFRKNNALPVINQPLPVIVGDDFVRKFRTEQTTIQSPGSVPKTEAIWIPLSELSGYVNNIDPNTNDGVRIYFGQISLDFITDGELREKLKDHNGQTTCVFMTTKAAGNGTHEDNIDAGTAVNLPNDVNELCPPPVCRGVILGQGQSLSQAIQQAKESHSRK